MSPTCRHPSLAAVLARSGRCLVLLLSLLIGLVATAAFAQDGVKSLVDGLGAAGFPQRVAAVKALAASGDPAVPKILKKLSDGQLYAPKTGGAVYVVEGDTVTDPLTGATVEGVPAASLTRLKLNNALRGAIGEAMSQLTLLSPDRTQRLAAARDILASGKADNLSLLDGALAKEQDAEIKAVMEQARAVIMLKTDVSIEEKRKAIENVAARGNRDALTLLTAARAASPPDLLPLIDSEIAAIETKLAVWDVAQNIWYGLSLGSVLLLAAIGLAITFGVMGVINMAHGEMVMLGAYTTYVVQQALASYAPGLSNLSLVFAVPAAFLFTGLVGIAIERGIIRWLYGRPLETLLATWGLSLILQQTIRTIFGPTNRQVDNPSWMSGAFDVGAMSITYNRLWIIVFSLFTFLALLTLLKRSKLGLQMRAVTQNRRMASSMGIRTPMVDAMTFGLGSGIAGIAGVALSQIDNVSPNLGQNYIIDSFMVVVFGGVGNLWGTFVGALSLGIANKFLEPYAGAVLGKILILVLIILFIQRRPRGLFALKGRAIE
ncbi:urea ABC transporter permease subunit UrtB [Rhizobium sp. CC-YZS058]|uniref:urea ABC transporter permease subunit UrtB n=1 Tax=Rhizobium sp. CC-YZS058 TaxID=3042153 RepID=UPI002B057F02|nr:urea ABC transporter permease subunit UrtB [Rhizobium sp. CC-YZS058]MEA3533996.1 urea ABC transporter permease subunit UrtB [Rhizobium sp. CC-YZS058]